jgi:hypothetical protein
MIGAVAVGGPVGAEIVGEVEHAQMREAHAVEKRPGWGDVGAVGPGAASAIKKDRLAARQRANAGAKDIQAGGGGRGASVFGAGDMRLVEEHVGADLEDEIRVRIGLELLVEGFGLDEGGGWDRGGGLREGVES